MVECVPSQTVDPGWAQSLIGSNQTETGSNTHPARHSALRDGVKKVGGGGLDSHLAS